MRVINPVRVTDSHYIAGNLTEDAHAEWLQGTDYVRGNFVAVLATHSIYQCLRDHTAAAANSPTAEAIAKADPLTEDPDPEHWIYISQTNKWRLFDERPSQQAEATEELFAGILLTERVSAVVATELEDCSAASVRVTHGATECELEWTKPNDGGTTISHYQYRQRVIGEPDWGAWTDMRNSTQDTLRWIIQGLHPENSYQFQVRAVNADGRGGNSNTANMTIQTEVLNEETR